MQIIGAFVLHRSKSFAVAAAAALAFLPAFSVAGASGLSGGWWPKFYDGLEANGTAVEVKGGYKGAAPCIEIRYLNGAQKFGIAKDVKSGISGPIEWTVAADVICEANGEAGAAIEFFDAKGVSLGTNDGEGVRPAVWTRQEWRFMSPPAAKSASVHLLSLATGGVRIANIEIRDAQGREEDVLQMTAKPLPVAWNRDWNGGRAEFTSFATAPLPMAFHFKGDKARLKRPAFEIELPDDLELADAFTEHEGTYRKETPVSRTAVLRGGVAYTRLRFEGIGVFYILQPAYGWERKLALVIALKPSAARRQHEIYWRCSDATHKGMESRFTMKFADLPQNLRRPKNFDVLSWQNDDLMFSSDAVLEATLPAYEAAGLTWFCRKSSTFKRGKEVERLVAARPTRWRFKYGFADLWYTRFLGADSEDFKALNVNRAVSDDGKSAKGVLCPDYFNNDPEFGKYYREKVLLAGLKRAGVKDGDMVTSDFEPWGSQHYCVCDRCRAAFARHLGLAQPPTVAELKKFPDEWAEFRCTQTEETIRRYFQIIREYNPNLLLCDYDYILDYGSKNEKAFFKGCAKDTARNEKWFDMHICSYYHTCDLKSFQAIRNNTRHLKKPYLPLGAVGGYGGYLRTGEVRHPRQLRMLALAAFVHNCFGVGFYQGIHYDGEHLLAFMKARDEIAATENFKWRVGDGPIAAISDNAQFVFAAGASADGGEEIVALFNYDGKAAANVRVTGFGPVRRKAVDPVSGRVISEAADSVAGLSVDVPPEDVRLIVFKKQTK